MITADLNNRASSDSCNPPRDKIPVHVRCIMTRENRERSGEFAAVSVAAMRHVNEIGGILDDYHVCYQWDHAKVSSNEWDPVNMG